MRRAVSMAIDRDAIGKAVYNGQSAEVGLRARLHGQVGAAGEQARRRDAAVLQVQSGRGEEAARGRRPSQTSQVRLVNPFASHASTGHATSRSRSSIRPSTRPASRRRSSTATTTRTSSTPATAGARATSTRTWSSSAPSASYTEADDWLFSYFHSKSTSNQEHLNDPTYDAMIDKERTLVNDDERVKAVQDIQTYLAEKMYAPSTVGSIAYGLPDHACRTTASPTASGGQRRRTPRSGLQRHRNHRRRTCFQWKTTS